MSTRPEQGNWMTRTLVGYCNLIEPARSAAEYAQYWQQKATIFGSNSAFKFVLLVPFRPWGRVSGR
ncbi:hypothetical protein FAK_11450 [Desulfoferula mesophila]|uniref:Uncharacterized protein n=1 Tax=Desulfoferula mesophila TaxID=3058419 RepID=A0AAU9ELK5_9BACT|nr:hypothetical protein FAK_11450 [Desulfoferula mesophilus]